MAKIVLSDLAPSDAKHFSLANENFDVPHETDDRVVLANAEAHPWLDVDYGKVASAEAIFRDPTVAYNDDPFAAPNTKAFDHKAIDEAQKEEAAVVDAQRVAIDANLDQGTKVESDGVAETLAADDTHSDKKTAGRKSGGSKEN